MTWLKWNKISLNRKKHRNIRAAERSREIILKFSDDVSLVVGFCEIVFCISIVSIINFLQK